MTNICLSWQIENKYDPVGTQDIFLRYMEMTRIKHSISGDISEFKEWVHEAFKFFH